MIIEAVPIPNGLAVDIEGRKIIVKGPKGTLEKNFDDPRFNSLIDITLDQNKLVIKSWDEKRKVRAMIGTMQSHVKNMIAGVNEGYKYSMKIVYTHFPMSVNVAGNKVEIKNFLGEKGARIADIAGDCKIHVDKENIEISGINVEDVSQTAANIENACKLRGRDRRIFQDGIYITERYVGNKAI